MLLVSSVHNRIAWGLEQLFSQSAVSPRTGSDENLIVILDRSGSMAEPCGNATRLDAAQDATIDCLDARQELSADDAVMVIAFADRASVVLPLTLCRGHRDRIDSAIRSIRARGGTNIKKPLEVVLKLLTTERNVHIVLLSDGHGSDDPTLVAGKIKGNGAIIETVGVGNDPTEVDEPTLKKIASVLDGKVLYRFIRDAHEMRQYFRTDIANRLVRRSQ